MPRFAANLTFLFQNLAFMDRFAAAAEQGFMAVEFMSAYEHAPAAVAAALRDNGLRMALMNSPAGDLQAGERGLAALPERRRDFRTSIGRALDYCAATGCPLLHVMAGIVPEKAERRLLQACYMDNLAWAAEQARQAGVALTIEPINGRDIPGYFLQDYDYAETVLKELKAPNLHLQFDMYHVQVLHGDVSMRLERQLPLIAHVQVANPPDRAEPDIGELNYDYLFRKLDALGYAGWVGAEYKPTDRTETSLNWFKPYRGKSSV
ncbi:2-oxo-tetronate isomerase [Ferrovibrio sp.]|uniref:2-oxo-tetronate isomerase n=1 Tax=Ferrovibrio sp. TaxID=1917215 RepID=UPI0025C02F3B|nr:2-oxo-tetronate isomerase [Ferrovibrio sp.]MBX3454994.1 TIM barrel protein [Ferrovibrio sp.]